MSETNFKIFKYVLSGEKEKTVEMPGSAQILEVDFQPHTEGVELCLWALVHPAQPKVQRRVRMVDTGEALPDEIVEHFRHIKTIQMVAPRLDEEGEIIPKSIIFHLFLEKGVTH